MAVLIEEVCPLDMVYTGISIKCIRMCLPLIAEKNSPIYLRLVSLADSLTYLVHLTYCS